MKTLKHLIVGDFVTESRSGCLLLRKPILERQVLMQRKVVYFQVPATWKMGTQSPSPSPPLSGGRGFYKEGEENRTKRPRERVEKFSTCRRAQCILITQVMVQCASSWFSHPGSRHPGFTSAWFYISLTPSMQVSTSPWAGVPEGQTQCLLKLVPRILTRTCCFSTSYLLVRVHAYRNKVKRMAVRIRTPHCYKFPLLQFHIVFAFSKKPMGNYSAWEAPSQKVWRHLAHPSSLCRCSSCDIHNGRQEKLTALWLEMLFSYRADLHHIFADACHIPFCPPHSQSLFFNVNRLISIIIFLITLFLDFLCASAYISIHQSAASENVDSKTEPMISRTLWGI